MGPGPGVMLGPGLVWLGARGVLCAERILLSPDWAGAGLGARWRGVLGYTAMLAKRRASAATSRRAQLYQAPGADDRP